MGLAELRSKIESSPMLGAGVAGFVLLFAIGFYFLSGEKVEGPLANKVYFYDVDAGKIFVVSDDDNPVPPITAPSGGEGVAAIVFSCGDCDDESSLFVTQLKKYTDKAKTAMVGDDLDAVRKGTMVRSAAGGEWVTAESDKGQEISSINPRKHEKCQDANALRQCNPK